MQHKNQNLFKPSKEFSRNARIKNICEYYDLWNEAEENFGQF